MTDRATLTALRERLRALPPEVVRDDVSVLGNADALILQTKIMEALGCADDHPLWRCPPILTSIDNALALVERMLPGSPWCMGRAAGGRYYAGVARPTIVNAPTPPVALLDALLTTLIAQKKETADG